MATPQQKKAWVRLLSIVALVLLFMLVYFKGASITPTMRFGSAEEFAIAPYLQLGRTGHLEDLEVVWGTTDDRGTWSVEWQGVPGVWVPAGDPVKDRVAIEGVQPFWLLHTPLHALIPAGVGWRYRIAHDGKQVFEAPAAPFHSGLEPYRFAVMGDVAYGGQGQLQVAQHLYRAKPDVLLLAGDIVYLHGRLNEYLRKFYPVFNADRVSLSGVPMMRSTLFAAVPGNHDTAVGAVGDSSDFWMFPDGLAYYELWKQPLNGPELPRVGGNIPNLRGSGPQVESFLRAAGESFPRMGTYSFDYGNAHFVMLDANKYMNWTTGGLRTWLEADLKKASLATWKFVVCHQPPFSSDLHHYNEQQMRLVADILQRNHVDVFFAGHVHNYQRTRPLLFEVQKQPDGRLMGSDFTVNGVVKMDMKYDGVLNRKPGGIIYVVTGCGGASLVNSPIPPTVQGAPHFTVKQIPQYSFTQCDVSGRRLIVQQVDLNGKVLDRFELEK